MNTILFRLAEIATALDGTLPEEAEQLDQALRTLAESDNEEEPQTTAPATPAVTPPAQASPMPPVNMSQPAPAVEPQPDTAVQPDAVVQPDAAMTPEAPAAEETEESRKEETEEQKTPEETESEAAAEAPAVSANEASYAPGDIEAAIDGLADLLADSLVNQGWDLGTPEAQSEFQDALIKQIDSASMY